MACLLLNLNKDKTVTILGDLESYNKSSIVQSIFIATICKGSFIHYVTKFDSDFEGNL